MLEGLASPDAARLYLRLLLDDDPPADLAGDGHRATLAELSRLGLVRAASGPAVAGLAAVDPSEAVTRLLVGFDRQVAIRNEEIGRLLRVLDGLRLDGETAAVAGQPGPVVEMLTDPAAISRVVRQSRVAAQTDYLAVVAAGPGGEPPLGWPDDVEVGEKAARVQILYAAVHAGRRRADALAEVRHGPAIPLDIRIIDHHTAVLALAGDPAGDSGQSAVVVRSEPIVGLLRSCFRLLWERAGATTTDQARSGTLTPFDRRVVALLAGGHRDADIARLTGTSVRTVRRRIVVIAGELDAESRFAAGVEAYRRGMVDPG
jgi:DNA-binding CsgD family transcriptional regulator